MIFYSSPVPNDFQIRTQHVEAQYKKLKERLRKDRDRLLKEKIDLQTRLGIIETKEKKRVYVASSWRNEKQPAVVDSLRMVGHEIYDFRSVEGFHWSDIDSEWESWTPEKFRENLEHPLAQAGFESDFKHLKWAEVLVLVMPCGRSAHLEAGWFVGKGKPTIILLDDGAPELMYKMCNICVSIEEVVKLINTF